jgi:hypothetical protein
MRRIVVALMVSVTACGGGVAGLPPAPHPEEFEGGPWAVEFSTDLTSGFWEVGAHRYQIWLDCEPLGPREWSQHNFESDTATSLYDSEVYVRFRGLSEHKTGPTAIKRINVDQETIAVVTVLGLEETQAERAAAECVAELRLEDGTVISMPPSAPFRV